MERTRSLSFTCGWVRARVRAWVKFRKPTVRLGNLGLSQKPIDWMNVSMH